MHVILIGKPVEFVSSLSKDGKPYSYAAIYSGREVVRVYGLSGEPVTDKDGTCRIECILTFDLVKGRFYFRAISAERRQ